MNTVTSLFATYAPGALVAVVTIVLSTFPLLIDFAKSHWRKRFREQIKKAISRGALSFADMQHVAERWNQDRNSVLQSLRVLLTEALAGEDKDLEDHVEAIRVLLAQHQSREPYAELPENIGIQLKRISELNAQNEDPVTQLATSLSELYSSNQREAAKQKKLSFWGFVVGVVGVLLSVPGLYIAFKS